MAPRNRRLIDLSILESNMRCIRSSVPPQVKILAVIKADAYGHGAEETARSVLQAGADMLAVAAVSEGTALRRAGITAPILVLGAVTEEDVSEGVASGLIQTVCSPAMVALCEKAAEDLSTDCRIHLKIDTGMGRIGVRTEDERDAVLHELEISRHVRLTGAFTHFCDADGGEDGCTYTREQFRRFQELTSVLPDHVLRHCCNSAAAIRFPEMHMDMIRAGISLYGYPPVPTALPLRPAMSWIAGISYIKEIPEGTWISYGRIFRSDRPMKIATVTCGYGDGYPRCASGRAHVLIRGRKVPVVGRICMDQMMADVSGLADVKAGDEAVLIGRCGDQQITAEDIASWADTISYEILLNAGNRVERVIRDDSEKGGSDPE